MDFERNYQVKTLSNQSSRKENLKFYSSLITPKIKLNPYFITGFVDGEGCFSVMILKNPRTKTGFRVQARFLINIHKKDKMILSGIQSYFKGIGNMYNHGKDGVQYLVSSVNDLSKIVDHFDKYPLITKKQADFLIFKQIIDLIKCKDHLTIKGLQQIVNLRASMNNGLPVSLKVAFPNTIPVQRPFVQKPKIIGPN